MIMNFEKLLQKISSKYSNKVAFGFNDPDKKNITYKEFYADVDRLVKALPKNRITVGLLGENSYEWVLLYFALIISGNTVVPLDTSVSIDTLVVELKIASCTNIFCSKNYLKVAIGLNERLNNNLSLFSIDEINCGLDLAELGKINNSNCIEDDASVIIYTSGTTDIPKGVMLSQKNLIADAISTNKNFKIDSTVLLTLPLFHAFGLMVGILMPLLEGAKIIFCDTKKSLVSNIHVSKAETILVVPAMAQMLKETINKEEGGSRKLGNIKKIISGGAALNKKMISFFDELGIYVIEGYGLSECGPVVSANGDIFRKVGSVGKIIDCCTIRIDDKNDNGQGEILVKGENITSGYLNSKQMTKAAFENDFFKTGDIGYIDDEGYLFITGRNKNIIVLNNGKKISPEELENYIYSIPYVKEVQVFLDNDEEREFIAADIYCASQINDEEIKNNIIKEIDRINDGLPVYKKIKKILFRMNEFKKTATQKIIRNRCDENQIKILQTIKLLLEKVIESSVENITIYSDIYKDIDLDSFGIMALLAELNEIYDMNFTETDLRLINKVGDIISLVQERANSNA